MQGDGEERGEESECSHHCSTPAFHNKHGGEGRGQESDYSHHYSTPAFQNKYEGRGGGGKWVLLSIISLHPLSKKNKVFEKVSEILQMDYIKKLSSFTRHQITQSLFSLHRSNYMVISGNQKKNLFLMLISKKATILIGIISRYNMSLLKNVEAIAYVENINTNTKAIIEVI